MRDIVALVAERNGIPPPRRDGAERAAAGRRGALRAGEAAALAARLRERDLPPRRRR